MPFFSGRRWALWFALAAALLTLNAAVFYRDNQSAIASMRLVGQSRQVLASLGSLLATLDEAETGQRGYLLTGDLTYLQPYASARTGVEDRIAELLRATNGDAADRAGAGRIAALTATKFAELQETIALQRKGLHAAAIRLVLSNSGQRLMTRLRAAIGSMTNEENRELARREADAQDAVTRERITLVLASLGNLLLLAALGFVTQRALAARERVAEERKRSLEIERAARERAEAAARMREEFLTVAAHELNTPLAALQGSAQLLHQRARREGGLEPRQERLLTLLTSQANRLALLVGMLLDTSRLQSDRLTLATRPLDIVGLVAQVAREMQTVSARHPIQLEAPEVAIPARGDPMRLQQVLHNLIQNAIKYSPRGGAIRLRVEADGDWALIAVSDQGIGIPAADLPHIFDRFFRASNTNARSISGIGMGLYVAHGIVALHGGTLTAASAVGEGTTFTIRLPRAAPERVEERAADAADLPATLPTDAATTPQETHR